MLAALQEPRSDWDGDNLSRKDVRRHQENSAFQKRGGGRLRTQSLVSDPPSDFYAIRLLIDDPRLLRLPRLLKPPGTILALTNQLTN